VISIRIAQTPEGGLRRAAERARSSAPAWRVIAQRLRSSILKNFEDGGWYPQDWPASQRAKKTGGMTLVDNAHLRNSVHGRSGTSYAAAGPQGIVYAAIHQFGGMAGPGRSVEIPARPYLPERDGRLHNSDAVFVDAVLGRYIAEGRTS